MSLPCAVEGTELFVDAPKRRASRLVGKHLSFNRTTRLRIRHRGAVSGRGTYSLALGMPLQGVFR